MLVPRWERNMLNGRKFVVRGFIVFGLILLACIVLVMQQIGSKSTRMTTRWVCPCVYAEGRSLDYCISTLPVPVDSFVSVKADDEGQVITARAFFVFSSTARRVPQQSCLMES